MTSCNFSLCAAPRCHDARRNKQNNNESASHAPPSPFHTCPPPPPTHPPSLSARRNRHNYVFSVSVLWVITYIFCAALFMCSWRSVKHLNVEFNCLPDSEKRRRRRRHVGDWWMCLGGRGLVTDVACHSWHAEDPGRVEEAKV